MFFVGQPVWIKFSDYLGATKHTLHERSGLWPAILCSPEEETPINISPPPGSYFVKLVSGEFGFASAIQPLNSLSLEQALRLSPPNLSDEITKDYSIIVKIDTTSKKEARPQPQLVVKMTKQTQGVNELIEIVAGVKTKCNEMREDKLDDNHVPDDLIDQNELREILQVYNQKGFLGILERYGLSFRNLQFSLNSNHDIKPNNTIAHQIFTKNSQTLPSALKEYMGDFLTLFGIQFSNYKPIPIDEEFQHFCNSQYEKAKLLSLTLENTKPSLQYRILRFSSEDNIFLPLFKLKNVIQSKTEMAEMTFQEYFSMIFKHYHIFSNKDDGSGVFFKTCELLDSKSLKLSFNIMNKKWIENYCQMHSDFVLMHSKCDFIHYFAIGEFESTALNSSTAEEFLCTHKDTLKIILEGRSVLKDIACTLVEREISDEAKRNLLIRLFLIDTAGKVVILKISPVFANSCTTELHGIFYKISYSPLLDLFKKEDFFTILSEIDDCVKMATSFEYPNNDGECKIRSICPIPITHKSMSAISKIFCLPTVKLKSFRMTLFNNEDEQNLFNYIEEQFPNLTIFKTEIVLDSSDLSLNVMVSKVRNSNSFEFNTTSDTNKYANPIVVGYPILLENSLFVKVIELINDTTSTECINFTMSDEDETIDNEKESVLLNPKRNSEFHPMLDIKLRELTFKSWRLGIPQQMSIHSQENNQGPIGPYTRYVCYCECEYLPKQTLSFVKICSTISMELTCNQKILSHYVKHSHLSNHPNLIELYDHFIEDFGIPYSVFGNVKAAADYETSITISELLIPFSSTNLSTLMMENQNSKLVILFYLI